MFLFTQTGSTYYCTADESVGDFNALWKDLHRYGDKFKVERVLI
jgi:hypothetical protein